MKKFLLPLYFVLATAGAFTAQHHSHQTELAALKQDSQAQLRALDRSQQLAASESATQLALLKRDLRALNSQAGHIVERLLATEKQTKREHLDAFLESRGPSLEQLNAEDERLDRSILNLELAESNRLLRELGRGR